VKLVNGKSTSRLFWLAVIVVAGQSATLILDAISSLRVSDAEIAVAAPQDTLGIGIYPVLLAFGGIGLAALVWAWKQASAVSQRLVAAFATLVLVGSATFAAVAYNVLRDRVLK
jgi:hypothetical protein